MKLPKGYYAVASDFENAGGEFSFKGISYEVEKGINLFASVTEALASIGDETPESLIEGLSGELFTCPVLLMSAGRHHIGKNKLTWVDVKRSVAIIGQKACISPNLPSDGTLDAPALNPERANEAEESVLVGGYDYGAVSMSDPKIDLFYLDGVICDKDIRFRDLRVSNLETDCRMIFKNIIHKTPTGAHTYTMTSVGEGLPYMREAVLENIRYEKDFFDLGYGAICFSFCNPKTTLKNICIDGTTQLLGFSTITKSQVAGCRFCEQSEINIIDSYFARVKGENGLCAVVRGCALRLNIENTTFVDSSRENEAPLQISMPDDRSELILKNCRLVDTRGTTAPAIELSGDGRNIVVENTTFEGFAAERGEAPLPPTEAPDYIENREENWTTDTEDAHTVIGTKNADFSVLDAYYEGCKAYYGDQHVHSNSGGTSDGRTLLADWVPEMDKLGLDFAIIVDHRQMRGYFLPEWDEERMVMGTEPGASLKDPSGAQCIRPSFHYNMVFPHKYALAMVLANFPEFEFHGDELTGKFKYPSYTKERLVELGQYLRSIGGMLVHAHPRSLMGSDDPLDYYFGEHSYLEVIVGGCASHSSFKSYDTWCEILALGKHMFASGGSDTHRAVSAGCPSTFYTKRRFHTDFIERMYAGDYAVGGIGVKMMIDGHPMGSELAYKDGMKLTLRVNDYFPHTIRDNCAYELQVITDKGVAYSSRFSGKEPQAVSLEVQKRNFYRVIVKNLTAGTRVCVSNPIWLDKTEDAAEGSAE